MGVTPLAASAALWLRSGEQLQQSAGREESHAVYGRDCAQVGDDTDAEEDFTRVSWSASFKQFIFKNGFFRDISQTDALTAKLFA